MSKVFCPYCMTPVKEGESCTNCGLTALTYTPAANHLPPGTILNGRYMVGRVLGEGGFGITYIGCDLRLELKVAIKEYFPKERANRHAMASLSVTTFMGEAGASYERGKNRFLQEARTMAKMDKQPEIVSVRDFFEDNNTAYIVMEFISGTTFKDIVAQKGGRIPTDELFEMIEPLFPALSTMHGAGLVHRDISPDNLMLENGKVRLLDFGCAREAGQGGQTMTVILKHGYAPPEQYYSSGRQGPWTDVYALCATLYFCLTGKVPPSSMERSIQGGNVLIPPRQLGVQISAQREQALLAGLNVQIAERTGSVEELYGNLYAPEEITETVENETEETIRTEQEEEIRIEKDKKQWKYQLFAILSMSLLAIAGIAVTRENNITYPELMENIPTVFQPQQTVNEETESEAAFETLFADAAVLDNGDVEQLRALLADPSVSAIKIDGFLHIYDGSLEINKPVQISASGEVTSYAPVIIGEGGSINLGGGLTIDALVRCMDGGSFTMTSTGRMSGAVFFWLENEDDFQMEEGCENLVDMETWTFVLNEEEVFRNATVVEDYTQLKRANETETVSAIKVVGDITLPEHFACMKPLLITENSSLTCPSWDFDSRKSGELYLTEDTIFVNRGSFYGPINLGDGVGDIRINYGKMEGSIHTKSGNFFVNLGEATFSRNQLNTFRFVNMGSLTAKWQEGARFLDINADRFLNHGELYLKGQDQENRQDMTIGNGSYVFNSGLIHLDYAALHLPSKMINTGRIELYNHSDIDKNGLIESIGESAVISADQSSGIKTNLSINPASQYPNQSSLEGNVLLMDRMGDKDAWAKACTESDLRKYMDDPNCSAIYIPFDLELEGDWTFNKKMQIDGMLYVNGDLTLSGAEILSYDLQAERLIMEDQSVLLMYNNLDAGEIKLFDRCTLINCGNMSMGDLLMDNQSEFCNLGTMNLRNTTVKLQNRAEFYSGYILRLEGSSSVDIGGECLMDASDSLHFTLGQDASIVNNGTLELRQCDWQEYRVLGKIVNNNFAVLQSGAIVSGHIVNYGELEARGGKAIQVSGVLENHGTITHLEEGDGFYSKGGTFIGYMPVAEPEED